MGRDKCRVLVVDPQPIVQQGYEHLFAPLPDKELIGALASGEELCASYLRLRPDLVILDLQLPGISGIETIRRLLRRNPDARILVHTSMTEVVYVCRSMQNGARGFLGRHAPVELLLQAVEEVAGGGVFLEHELAQQVAYARTTMPDNPFQGLTPREFEVAVLLANGEPLTEIARRMALSYKTVAGYSSSIRAKLGTRTRTDLVRLALNHGILQSR